MDVVRRAWGAAGSDGGLYTPRDGRGPHLHQVRTRAHARHERFIPFGAGGVATVALLLIALFLFIGVCIRPRSRARTCLSGEQVAAKGPLSCVRRGLPFVLCGSTLRRARALRSVTSKRRGCISIYCAPPAQKVAAQAVQLVSIIALLIDRAAIKPSPIYQTRPSTRHHALTSHRSCAPSEGPHARSSPPTACRPTHARTHTVAAAVRGPTLSCPGGGAGGASAALRDSRGSRADRREPRGRGAARTQGQTATHRVRAEGVPSGAPRLARIARSLRPPSPHTLTPSLYTQIVPIVSIYTLRRPGRSYIPLYPQA